MGSSGLTWGKKVLYAGVLLVVLVAIIGTVAFVAFKTPEGSSATKMVMVVLFGIGMLMLLVFIIAAAFHVLGMTDITQSLGLPKGTVRALIALCLIVVFVIFGMYVFGESIASSVAILPGLTIDQVSKIPAEKIIAIEPNEVGEQPKTFDVKIRVNISAQSAQLGQQLITIVGTLIGAVAGFYFGSRAQPQTEEEAKVKDAVKAKEEAETEAKDAVKAKKEVEARLKEAEKKIEGE
jgi:CRISPR/Cas system type I-B associated protein Csh2 (Cas7 group RAMP superfamily)